MFSDIVVASQAKYPVTDKSRAKLRDKAVEYPSTENSVLRCNKVYLYPNDTQRKKLHLMISGYTKVYNEALRIAKRELGLKGSPILNKKEFYDKFKPINSERKFRDRFKPEIEAVIDVKKHYLQSHFIDEAINEVIRAYKAGFSNLKAKNINHFRLRYRKLSKKQLTVTIPRDAFSQKSVKKPKNTFFSSILGDKIKSSSKFKGVNHACKLQYNPGSKKVFTLFVPKDTQTMVSTSDKTCSLDPGVRTFQTVYDTESYFDIGTQMGKKIRKYKALIDRKKCNKPWYRKYSKRLYDRIKHIRDDYHFKTCKFLCSTYKTILIGNLSTKSVVRRGGNLQGETRDLLNLMSHFQFRERLIAKAEIYDAKVRVVDESYTSKTCGRCGKLNEKLGGSKVFSCECGFTCDRDFNGARNIMIKTLR